MKKIGKYILLALALGFTSCSYLDISPDLGLADEEVFTKYVNYKAYLDSIYEGEAKKDADSKPLNILYSSFPLQMDANAYRFTFADMTDLADAGRQGLRNELIKAGTLGENCNFLVDFRCPVFQGGWHCIRIANRCIENIDKLTDVEEDDKNDILGQAYFLRAWFHMIICCYYGGQPYLDHALQGNESWDIPRESAVVTFQKAAADFKTAYDYFLLCGRVRRDGPVGSSDHLNHSMQNRPNGVAAMALRGRCLLFAASPLSNTANDPTLWEDAAKANSEALEIADEYGYDLLPFDQWDNNCAFVKYTNEQLWAWNYGTNSKSSGSYLVNALGYPIHNATGGGGQNPTQNAVDLYETANGYPLFTEAERAIASKEAGYNDQNPYVGRDPRFYKNIIFDGATATGVSGVINIYYDTKSKSYPTTSLSGKNRSFGVVWNSANRAQTTTGYYTRKRWDEKYVNTGIAVTDPLIRLAEVYLNYAEAANMAYGPNGAVEGQITALQAVNKIRNRAGMPNVLDKFAKDKVLLNERIQNERTVEFMFEGHHYFIDERRWKIAPERMGGTLYGMYIETCTKDAAHPNGKIYTRTPITHQATWKDSMYYWYLYREEANKYKNYVNNEPW